MSKLFRLRQRIRHAGIRWTTRAVLARARKQVLELAPFRRIVDRSLEVDDEKLVDLIEWGDCIQGDFVARFVAQSRTKHFLDSSDQTTALAKKLFPEAMAKTIAVADDLCDQRFVFLGQSVHFTDTIDWAWLPEGGGSWAAKHVSAYTRSELVGEDRPGDIKYPWELSRHQHFVTLAKAYKYTGDEKYVRALCAQWNDWIFKNPFRHSVNWISEMELGIRIIAWSNAFWLVKDSPYFQVNALPAVMLSLYQHARYLRSVLTTHWLVANNHLIGETAGLFAFSVLFPQFEESARWRALSLKVFSEALSSQIYADGVNKEQSTGYHRFVVDFILVVVQLAERNAVPVPPAILDRLHAMLRYEAAILPPNRIVPPIGDGDDGRGIALSEYVPFYDFSAWQAYAAWRFKSGLHAQAAQGGNEEALWLLGAEAWNTFVEIKPRADAIPSAAFNEGGHYVLRAGLGDSSSYVFVRCGEFGLGLDGSSVHSHGDILAPVIHWRGEELAIDSGTYGYLCEPELRDGLRRGASHNTMLPEGLEQAELISLWNWDRVPHSACTEWKATGSETQFTGGVGAPDGFTHTRSFTLEALPHRLSIQDALTYQHTDIPHRVLFRLHLAPQWIVALEVARIILTSRTTNVSVNLSYEGFSDARVEPSIFSPSYGILRESLCVVLSATSDEIRTVVRISDSGELGS